MHCSLSFKAASNKYDSLKTRVFSCFRVGKAKPDPAFHHLDSGVCQIIQVVDRDWVLFHNHRDQKWLWKPPCVGRQPVHQGIAASEDDCCTIWILRAEIQGRKPLKLPQGDWLLVSASWWEHFNGNSTKSLRKFDHCYWIPPFFITRCLFPSLLTSPTKYGLVVEITMQCEGRTERAQPDHVNFVQFVVDQEGGLTWFGEEPLPCTVLGWWETGPTDGGNDKKWWACDFLDRSWSEQTSNVAYPLVI